MKLSGGSAKNCFTETVCVSKKLKKKIKSGKLKDFRRVTYTLAHTLYNIQASNTSVLTFQKSRGEGKVSLPYSLPFPPKCSRPGPTLATALVPNLPASYCSDPTLATVLFLPLTMSWPKPLPWSKLLPQP